MRRLLITTVAALAVVVAVTTFARTVSRTGTAPAHGSQYLLFTNEQNVAVGGYDVVSYFLDGKPAAGDDRFTTRWHGATWKFANAEHLKEFESNPERFAPQYGGYCAWGVAAKDDLFETDPNAWKIVDGKLYLNFNSEVQQTWLGDIAGFIRDADQKWPALVQQHTGS